MFVCMYVCMHACTKSFLKTKTNSLCVCTHLANKADSDSDSPKIQRHTGQVNWRLLVSVNMNVRDGLAICPGACPAYDPGKAPAS